MAKIKFNGRYAQQTVRYARYDVEFDEEDLLDFVNEDRDEGEEYTSVSQIPDLEEAIKYYVYCCEDAYRVEVDGDGDPDWVRANIER